MLKAALSMSLKSSWHLLKTAAPGRRFEMFYEHREQNRTGNLGRVLWIGLGAVLTVAGVVFLALPGPGLLVIALGLALVAGEFRAMAKALDGTEVWVRGLAKALHEWWLRLQPFQRAASVATCALLLLGAATLAWNWWM